VRGGGDELEGVDVVALVAGGDEAGDDLVGAVAGQVLAQSLPDDGGSRAERRAWRSRRRRASSQAMMSSRLRPFMGSPFGCGDVSASSTVREERGHLRPATRA